MNFEPKLREKVRMFEARQIYHSCKNRDNRQGSTAFGPQKYFKLLQMSTVHPIWAFSNHPFLATAIRLLALFSSFSLSLFLSYSSHFPFVLFFLLSFAPPPPFFSPSNCVLSFVDSGPSHHHFFLFAFPPLTHVLCFSALLFTVSRFF